jgi:hypothetical protein
MCQIPNSLLNYHLFQFSFFVVLKMPQCTLTLLYCHYANSSWTLAILVDYKNVLVTIFCFVVEYLTFTN